MVPMTILAPVARQARMFCDGGLGCGEVDDGRRSRRRRAAVRARGVAVFFGVEDVDAVAAFGRDFGDEFAGLAVTENEYAHGDASLERLYA